MRMTLALALAVMISSTASAQQTERLQTTNTRTSTPSNHSSMSWGLVSAINACQSQLAGQTSQEGLGQPTDRNPLYVQQFAYCDQIFKQVPSGGNTEGENNFIQSCNAYYTSLKKFTQSAGDKEQISQITSLNNAVCQAISADAIWSDPNCKAVASDMLNKSMAQIRSFVQPSNTGARKIVPNSTTAQMAENASSLVASIARLHGIEVQNGFGQATDGK